MQAVAAAVKKQTGVSWRLSNCLHDLRQNEISTTIRMHGGESHEKSES